MSKFLDVSKRLRPTPCNLPEWKKSMFDLTMTNMPKLANIIQYAVYEIAPEPSMPVPSYIITVVDTDADTGEETIRETVDEKWSKLQIDAEDIKIKIQFESAIRNYSRDQHEREKSFLNLYGSIWSSMSEASKSLVLRQAYFNEKDLCPIKLMSVINDTHQLRVTTVKEIDEYRAMRQLYNATMPETSSLAEWKRTIEEYSRTAKFNSIEITEKALAAIFMSSLNKHHSEFTASVINSSINGADFPSSLEEAYLKASSYVPLQKSSKPVNLVDISKKKKKKTSKDKLSEANKKIESSTFLKETSHKTAHPSADKRKVQKCVLCPGESHFFSDCPRMKKLNDLEEDEKKVKKQVNITRAAMTGDPRFLERSVNHLQHVLQSHHRDNGKASPYDLILDNGATISICSSDCPFITNIRPSDETFTIVGIGGFGNFPTVGIADIEGLTTVHVVEEKISNILSWNDIVVDRNLQINWLQDELCFEIVTEKKNYYFNKCPELNGLYVCNFRSSNMVLTTTVSENLNNFTKSQIKEANVAKRLSAALGFQTDESMKTLINKGTVHNVPITSAAVTICKEIYGPPVEVIQGTTVSNKVKNTITEPAILIDKSRRTKLYGDIIFINNIPFLLMVTSNKIPLPSLLTSRSTDPVRKAVLSQISYLRSKKVIISELHTDLEGAFRAMSPDIKKLGILHEERASKDHVGRVERCARTVKEGCRKIISSLPYDIPGKWIESLVTFVTDCIIIMPDSEYPNSQNRHEWLHYRKISYDQLQLAFGDFVHIHEEPLHKNSMEPRSSPAIFMTRLNNASNTNKFYNLSTNKFVFRKKFTHIPMTNIIIDSINLLAKQSENSIFNKHINFKFRNSTLLDSTTTTNTIEEFDASEILDNIDFYDEVEIEKNLRDDDTNIRNYEGDNLDLKKDIITEYDQQQGILHDNNLDLNKDIITEYDQQQGIQNVQYDPVEQQNIVENMQDDHVPNTDNTHNDEYVSNNPDPPTQVKTDDDPAIPTTSNRPSRNKNKKYQEFKNTLFPRKNVNFTEYMHQRFPRKPRSNKDLEYFIFNITVSKALKEKSNATLKAIYSEIKQLHAKNTFRPINPRDLTRNQYLAVIRSHIFLKEKYATNGDFIKLKARLVAGGHMQIKDLYDDLSSPTTALQSIYMIAAIAARENRKIVTLDITGAYLNADIEGEDVYMLLDDLSTAILLQIEPNYKEFVQYNGTCIVKLKKALYGLVQSALLWYKHISATLEGIGFIKNPSDHCVFNLEGREQCTVVLYVDDLLMTCKDQAILDIVVKHIRDIYKDITVNTGKKHDYLGALFDFTTNGTVKISMKKYIEDLIEAYGITKTAKSPAGSDLLNISEGTLLDKEGQDVFHSAIAKLLYLSKRVRPEIQFAVSFLCTRVNIATEYDNKKLVRVLQYLKDDPDLGLTLEIGTSEDITIDAYVDAAYGNHTDGKGHTGMLISLGKGGAVNAKSTKQKLVSKSSTEAELIAVSDSSSQIIWTRDFLANQGYNTGPANIYQDNQSTIKLVEKGKSTSEKTRHINIRYFFIKDRVDNGELIIRYLPTDHMIADILTKPLQGTLFIKLRNLLLNHIPQQP